MAIGLSNLWAYQFSAVSPSGHTLCYNIVNGNAEVTYYSTATPAYYNLTGALVIPSTVTYNGTTYSVTSIGNYAFEYCSSLTSVTIPNSVTSIGDYAFSSCSGLTSVTIPNSVTTIGRSAFSGCSGLTIVAIPNSVTSIENSAFSRCSGLARVIIGNSVTYIGERAFAYCSGLTSITVATGNTHYDSRNGCNAIIETSSNTLIAGCENTTIPNSVTSIGEGAFESCSGLTSVTIGNSVTSIGYGAFGGCSGLTEITSLAPTAPSLGNRAFNNVNTQIPVNIPCGSMASYMSGWSDFSNFNEVLGFTFSATSNDSTMGSVSVLTEPTCTAPQAVISAVPAIGYRFDHWSNGVTDNPYSLTVDSDTVLIAFFMPVESGIEDVCTSFSVVCQNGELLLSGAEGQMLSVYDIQGRLIVREKAADGKRYRMPYGGVYMVQLGNDPARKVVVK